MATSPPAEMATNDLGSSQRRFDLDWLRVIAFGLLIYYHAAIAFIPDGMPMIQNQEISLSLQVMAAFLHEFRLALLFLISGVGVFFALRHRNRTQFMRERSVRLLVPFVFGLLVIVPPMVFLEKRFIGDITGDLLGSFVEFYFALFTDGVYPSGHLSWHHYWFIAYLFLFCVIAWPIFAYFKRADGRVRLLSWSRRLSRGAYLYTAIIPLAVVEIALRARYPGFPDLIHDWARFSQFLMIFITGYVLASSTLLLDRAEKLRSVSFSLATLASATLFALFWSPDASGFASSIDGNNGFLAYMGICVLRVANVWFWLLTCLGYAGRYLQRPSRILSYLNNAIYPLFCLHLTVIVALEYLIVPLGWSMWVKYLVITTGTVAITLGSYELIRRRVAWLRPLVGLKTLDGDKSITTTMGRRKRPLLN
jgi:glucan biosynthesis protein C